MKIGIGIPNQVRDVRPEVIPEWARLAEESGFSSLTTVGRYAYPGVSETVALAGAAAVTRRIELISGVLLAATWPGALLAKELAGIDGISGGRLSVGIGSGQRPDDFVADGHGPAGRGARLDRDLETYRGIWRGDAAGGGFVELACLERGEIAGRNLSASGELFVGDAETSLGLAEDVGVIVFERNACHELVKVAGIQNRECPECAQARRADLSGFRR